MNSYIKTTNNRILIIDDNSSIHDDFDKILSLRKSTSDDLVADFLGTVAAPENELANSYQLCHAMQGEEGVAMAKSAVDNNNPFSVAFVDMRMPPGWNGLQTIEELWKVDNEIQVVICTAYSEHSWREIQKRLGKTDSLLILKKPFDCAEVSQLAVALTEKWCLHRDLVEARDLAIDASKAKSVFVASMSHELRTPLNGLLGMAQLLAKTNLTPIQTSYLNACRSSGESLLTVIGDILDFSKIEAGEFVLDEQPTNLNQLVEGVSQAVWAGQQAFNRGVAIACQIAPQLDQQVMLDGGCLRQVLFNLLGNAVKFTESGKAVVSANCLDINEDRMRVQFSVQDTGIGIPAGRIDSLFDAFSQVDSSTTREYGGTGLGLNISQQLVNLMGGQIRVESELGVGSTFSFELEVSPNKEQSTVLPSGPQLNEKPRVALVGIPKVTEQVIQELLQLEQISGTPLNMLRKSDVTPDLSKFDIVLVDNSNDPDTLTTFLSKASKQDKHSLEIIPICEPGTELKNEDYAELGVQSPLMKPISQTGLLAALAKKSIRSTECLKNENQIATPATSVRVLLVEDNEINQMFAESIFDDANYDHVTCSNGQEALDVLDTDDQFDVIFMDCHMPVMDGFCATRKIREQASRGEIKDIPIVALTANAMAGDREECLSTGMNEYLTKPYGIGELTEMVERLLVD